MSKAFAALDHAITRTRTRDLATDLIHPRPQADTPARGFHTSKAWAQRWGLSLPRTMGKIAERVVAGKMERRVYRIQQAVKLYPVPHYRET
jgi:hypothetical protein